MDSRKICKKYLKSNTAALWLKYELFYAKQTQFP